MKTFALTLLTVALLSAGVRETPAVAAVRKALPCVVSIGAERTALASDPYIALLRDFFSLYPAMQRTVQEYSPLGSGVVVDASGLILTNWHVVRAAEGRLQINLAEDKKCQATLVGFDVNSDLCLLQAVGDLKDYHFEAATFAKADDVLLGETVLALGNPYGLERSVSQGLLSAVNRSLGEEYNDVLQTDAAINPGNSGGPLINLEGDVIGINQAIRSKAQGIGFAIPIKRVECFLGQWLLPETFSDVSLGVRVVPGKQGVVVSQAREDSGLKQGDCIVKVQNTAVHNVLDFCRKTWNCKAGDSLEFILVDGRKVNVKAVQFSDTDLAMQRLGLRLQKLTPTLCAAMNIPENTAGLVVSEVVAEEAYRCYNSSLQINLHRGDILLMAGGKRVQTLTDLSEVLRSKTAGDIINVDLAVFDRRRGYLRYQESIILK